jgi:hypothetical protein
LKKNRNQHPGTDRLVPRLAGANFQRLTVSSAESGRQDELSALRKAKPVVAAVVRDYDFASLPEKHFAGNAAGIGEGICPGGPGGHCTFSFISHLGTIIVRII